MNFYRCDNKTETIKFSQYNMCYWKQYTPLNQAGKVTHLFVDAYSS